MSERPTEARILNGLVHKTANHTVNFVDSIDKTHTQHIESYCARQKYSARQNLKTPKFFFPCKIKQDKILESLFVFKRYN